VSAPSHVSLLTNHPEYYVSDVHDGVTGDDQPESGLMRPTEYSAGDTIGPYRIVRLLGEGTTGRVFEVEHMRIGHRAAMKVVHRDAVLPGVVSRLFAEARAVNMIGHPHIVEIADVLEPSDGQPEHALVMELLSGRSLADFVSKQQPLATLRIVSIAAQVCDALAAVHAAGFIHRDLKPENVFLVQRYSNPDFVKLVDFGLVKAMRPDIDWARATADGTFLGSPAYASPEQAAGSAVDWRTDIYALGIMLYELVTGVLPFEGQSLADLLRKQVSEAPPRLPEHHLATDVGRALDAIIQTCLAKDPAGRALSAEQLAVMFRQLASGSVPAEARRPRRVALRVPRSRAMKTILPIAMLGAIALVVGPHTLGARSKPRAPSASAPASASHVAEAPTALAGTIAEAPAATASAPVPAIHTVTRKPQSSANRAIRARETVDKALTLDPYR
jgi:serine/threonine protein kinase